MFAKKNDFMPYFLIFKKRKLGFAFEYFRFLFRNEFQPFSNAFSDVRKRPVLHRRHCKGPRRSFCQGALNGGHRWSTRSKKNHLQNFQMLLLHYVPFLRGIVAPPLPGMLSGRPKVARQWFISLLNRALHLLLIHTLNISGYFDGYFAHAK